MKIGPEKLLETLKKKHCLKILTGGHLDESKTKRITYSS